MILALLVACETSPPTPSASAPARRPDVVVVTLDTVRADRLGAYGYAKARTDTLDRLAAGGLRFENAFSVLPLTIPAHSSLFTGLYPFHLGIRSNGDNVLADSFTTLAEHFRSAGYATGASVSAFVTTRQWGFAQGFDAYFDEMPEREEGKRKDSNYWHIERPGNVVVDDALAWLAMVDREKPVFLWVHLYDAHFPYRPPAAYELEEENRPYDGEIAFLDDQVQRLVDAFSGRDTITAIIADHGESLGDHGELTHGLYAFPSTQHVPWIVHGPGVEPRVVKEPVSSVDFSPTILTLAGLPVPTGLDGHAQPGGTTVPYAETYQLVDRFGIAPHRVLVEGNLLYLGTPRPELYDYVADPGTATDLAASRPDDLARLGKQLEALGASPPGQGAAAAEADADTLAALAALGYVATAAPTVDPATLPDPKDHAEFLRGVLGLDRPNRRGGGDDVMGEIDRLLALKPDAFDLRRRKSQALKRLGNGAAAAAFDEETARIFPDDPRVWLQLATLASIEQDFESALGHAERALLLDGTSAAARELVVEAQFRLGRDERAIEQGMVWMAEDRRNFGLAASLGRYWLSKRDYAKAEQFLRIAVSGPNPRMGARLRLAALAVAAGARHDGIKLLLAEVADYPGNAAGRLALARVYAEDGQYLEQLSHVRAAARMLPARPDVQLALAQCQFNLGDYGSARRVLDHALAQWPDDADIVLLHANLLSKEGKKAEGQLQWQRAKTLNDAR
ncbi:MAG: sulfatase-like hydrolase/transferase, partial [Deltaproteobacteria bacterium]|nr:sulfatase-like hydrolase/transferase [Deltaproteobacteria bacterium]